MQDLRKLLEIMVERRASDLYLKPHLEPTYRIDNTFLKFPEKLTQKDIEDIFNFILSNNESLKERFFKKKELDLSFSLDHIGRFRCNIYKQRGNISIVVRRVSQQIPSIDELNLPSILKELSLEDRGLILITGAAGAGKTTTLAAMVNHRNQNKEGHIIIIEDPIEFLHQDQKSMVSQREVGIDTDSFREALRHAIRQTPDMVVIGEMRDKDSVDAAVFFAETGHIVLSCLHSVNAQAALQRIIQFYPSGYHQQIFMQLSLNLRAIISQRLIPNKDLKRIVVTEVLLNTPRIKDLIRRGEIDQIKKAIEASIHEGMHTFDQNLLMLYKEGKISLDTALSFADNPSDLKLSIKLKK